MKKKVSLFLLIVVALSLFASLWKNRSYATEKEQLRVDMLYTTFQTLQNISIRLDELLVGLEDGTIPYEKCEDRLIFLSNSFSEVHFALTTYATHFPPHGTTRNCYSGHISFDFISRTLIGGWGELNYNRYNGIMYDNTISDKEVQYLLALKDSVDDMIKAMASSDDPYQLREITPSYLDEVILAFTDKYYIAYDDSPLKLLFE